MVYFFLHKSQICCQISNTFRLFLKIWVYFQAFKNSYPQDEKNFEIEIFGFGKKIGLDTDTEIRLWFRFLIPKPCLRILFQIIYTYLNSLLCKPLVHPHLLHKHLFLPLHQHKSYFCVK